ncbi:MAG TPA: hypothetical protein VF493_13060, partial [Terriglobales bacterium]
ELPGRKLLASVNTDPPNLTVSRHVGSKRMKVSIFAEKGLREREQAVQKCLKIRMGHFRRMNDSSCEIAISPVTPVVSEIA